MNRFARLLSSAALIVLPVAMSGFPAIAEDALPIAQINSTGNFLAGQQALVDLHTSEAASYFSAAVAADWKNPVFTERAFVALAADGQIRQAADAARHVLELDPQNDLAHLVIATEALKERRYGATERELQALTGDNFAGITGIILQSWAQVGLGRSREAIEHLDELGEDGLSDFLVFHQALMAEVSGQSDLAIDLARQAYEADPTVARIVEAYARILGNAGKFDQANAVIKTFESEGLTHPLIDQIKGPLSRKQRPGMFASNVQVGAAEMFHGIGVALARDGGTDLAMVFLRLGLYLEPNADIISMILGQLLDEAGQHEAANAVYERIPATSVMKPTAVVRIAQNLDALDQRPEALRRLGNIVATRPDDLEAVSALGDMLRGDKQYAEAAGAYTKALAITGGERPTDWRFYYVRGIAYERAGQWEKAEPDFLKALELNPEQPQVLNYLGYSWVDKGLNLGPALKMIRKAVNSAPSDGYIVDSLGWAYYRLARYDEAVQVLEQAVQIKPNDPEINDHLGDAYWRAGRKLEARFQWNIASSVDEDGNVKKRAELKLANGLDDAAPASGKSDDPDKSASAD